MQQLKGIADTIDESMKPMTSINIHIAKDEAGQMTVFYNMANDFEIDSNAETNVKPSTYEAIKEIIQRLTV